MYKALKCLFDVRVLTICLTLCFIVACACQPTKTISFRDERNRPSERWDLLFEHKLPLCKNFEGKSTPFVRYICKCALRLRVVHCWQWRVYHGNVLFQAEPHRGVEEEKCL